MTASFAAVDLGASNGRVMVGRVTADGVLLREVHRFANGPVDVGGALHWDILALYGGVLDGLRAAGREAGELAGIGIDSWAVDYGLLDADGALVGNPYHYRDSRTAAIAAEVYRRVPEAELYAITGLQYLHFNTLFQLAAARRGPQWAVARHLLLVPDLLTYWLTGERQAEVTNASTTQLLDVRTRQWAETVLERVEIPRSLLAPLVEPGHVAGSLRPEVAAGLGAARSAPVITVASHDTASAVAAVPATSDRFAYISCGTWSLVGLELESPVLSEESRLANFTNELGVDGTVRYLCNVAGMWLLQESLREWAAAGLAADLSVVVGQASRVPALRTVVDVNDPAFEAPGDMPSRIARAASERGEVVPRTPAETVRCILDSLALAYRRTIHRAQALAGRDVDVVHIVGGGARNELLCQLTADACGLPVLAGPVEAAALGNVVIQARARGLVNGGLPQLRALIRGGDIRRFTPTSGQAEWEAAARRVWR